MKESIGDLKNHIKDKIFSREQIFHVYYFDSLGDCFFCMLCVLCRFDAIFSDVLLCFLLRFGSTSC
jgi:hypothetical protein